MKIISKAGNEYYCKVISWGWSYARPSVAVKKTYKHWLTRKEIEYFEQVSDDNPWKGADG